jgi:hypothetical protein
VSYSLLFPHGGCVAAATQPAGAAAPPMSHLLLRACCVCVCVVRRAVAAHAQIPTHLPGRLGRQQLACVAGGARCAGAGAATVASPRLVGGGASGRCVRVPVRGAAAVARVDPFRFVRAGGGPRQSARAKHHRWPLARRPRREESSSRGMPGHTPESRGSGTHHCMAMHGPGLRISARGLGCGLGAGAPGGLKE